ncbi:acetylglutamate kinase [Verrucomicrobiota bacterium]
MEEIIRKAEVLVEALPYIQIVVIKFGGSAMEEKAYAEGILTDVVFMECVGMLPVVVHGGGKAITRKMKELGVESRFLKGLRVTCERSMAIVEQVMKEEINPEIIAQLERRGARAARVDGEKVFKVTKKTGTDEETGASLDWGYVGEPVQTDVGPLRELLDREMIPVVTPLGLDADGRMHNINADSAAAAAASALRSRKLVFLTDVPGLLRDSDDQTSVMSTLRTDEVAKLIEDGVIGGGMLPKVEGGVAALDAGVGKIHMVDGRLPHSLLLEIFTDKGVGTEIVRK